MKFSQEQIDDTIISNDIIQETYVMNKDGKVVPLIEDMQHSINDSKITITTSKTTLREISDE
jgi:hypothetical protein